MYIVVFVFQVTKERGALAQESQFDRDKLHQIEVIDLKPTYWLNQHFTPENTNVPLKVRLTDVNGNKKEAHYNDMVTLGGDRKVPESEYYYLSFMCL